MNRVIMFILLLCPSFSIGFELSEPVLYDGGVTERTKEQRNASYAAYDVIKEAGENVYRLHSLTNLGGGDIWYVFSKSLIMYGVDVSERQLIGSWPLARWKHDFIEPEFISALKSYDYEGYLESAALHESSFGCFSDTPMRYGDFDGSGSKELVLFLGNTIHVFSPEKESVIFSSNFGIYDWLNEEDTLKHFESWGSPPGDDDPQYQSRLSKGATTTWNARFPGYRGHAKLYFGDFNGDDNADILVWRKLYVSRLRGDSVQGFKPVRETLLHYSIKEGGYQPVETDESLIRAWLQKDNLTWQKGFPSKSECAGEEGELIPEMHDPLLNDPDVLQ